MKWINKYNNRRSGRYDTKDLVALHGDGVCKVLDTSETGLSMRCFFAKCISDTFQIDILDLKNEYLTGLKVKKIWEEQVIGNHGKTSLHFAMNLGVEFEKLCSADRSKIRSLIAHQLKQNNVK
ncbi:MAG: hypothetical protein GY799_18445 [Desulfobulbaceae bacterium]|nr:hypothetical protein [Desulfobulbaceae bacterium]